MSSRKNYRGSRRPRRRLGRRVQPNQDGAPFALRGGRTSGKGGTTAGTSSRNGAQNRSTRNNHSHHAGDEQHPDDTYKTEMCNNWIEYGKCRYNNKCRFAHGEEELRVARRINSDKNWKSELCRNYHSDGACSYGRRCHFIHEETPEDLARMHATQKRICGQKSQRGRTPMTVNALPRAKQRAQPASMSSAATVRGEGLEQQETKVPVGSPTTATASLASCVTSRNLHNPAMQQLAHEDVRTSPSSFSVNAPFVSSPIPISRKRSLQRFCQLVGLPVEETNPNEAAAVEPVLSGSPPSGESPPFLLRPQAAFSHMQGKIVYEPKTPFMLTAAPRTTLRMDHDSPAKRRVRLPVFTRIASDTGVALSHPPSPVTTSP